VVDFEAGVDQLHLTIPYLDGTTPPEVTLEPDAESGNLNVLIDGTLVTVITGGAGIDVEADVAVYLTPLTTLD